MSNNGSSRVHFLLVEDDTVDVMVIERAFKKHQISAPLTVVNDGEEALALLRGERGKASWRPYIILLDLNMPRMGGLEFLKELRADETIANHTVFVLSSSNLEKDRREAYKHNVAGYILKSSLHDNIDAVIALFSLYSRFVQFPPDLHAHISGSKLPTVAEALMSSME